MKIITEENYVQFCKDNYINIHCLDEEEFENDLKTLRYIKGLFRRYIGRNEVNIDILINHFIYIHNCFGDSIIEICFFDFEDYYFSLLKTMFIYLGLLPENIIINKIIYFEDITVDNEFLKKLKQSKHNHY